MHQHEADSMGECPVLTAPSSSASSRIGRCGMEASHLHRTVQGNVLGRQPGPREHELLCELTLVQWPQALDPQDPVDEGQREGGAVVQVFFIPSKAPEEEQVELHGVQPSLSLSPLGHPPRDGPLIPNDQAFQWDSSEPFAV